MPNELRNMKIFVTGGAGFIGRHLVDSLLKGKNKVTIYDNFKNSSEEKISPLLKKGALLVKGNITNYNSLFNALFGFDYVIHLGGHVILPDIDMLGDETLLLIKRINEEFGQN